ncbi:helix-turn-helix transcriptional regulator [Streptomyces sp. LP05-1]|uniref:Helix-turn-helix transcriptional regulator n=1 Tax=Streptomyces pyxinae TaxID=2970734 RepID=A0ABT2CGM8_9ACTN|nr:helix-turn-helix transcriptional regulator [Streptomyces sp. LP05-1]MCS0635866.1 helix-turn-helix transcriptional regulator [Streptomyces sp. LP05-1]
MDVERVDDPLMAFAERLKQDRELYPERRLTQADVARMVHMSSSTISRVESGRYPIPDGLPALLDRIFNTDGVYKRLYEASVAASFPVLFQRRMLLERNAEAIWEWSPCMVPGLLQTSRYAHSLIRKWDRLASATEVARLTAARVDRQEVFRRAAPPDVRMVLCASTLLRRPVEHDVMREQLAALLTHAQRPTVRLHVLPLDAPAHTLMDNPISILTTSTHETVICVEAYETAAIIQDLDKVRTAVRAYHDLSEEALSARASAEFIRDQMEKL